MGRHAIWGRILALLVLAAGEALSWGGTGHRIINQNAVMHLPPEMGLLSSQQAFLTQHASDADARKGSDPTEGPKHFIDIDDYPDFQHLTLNLDSLVARYGRTRVEDIGLLPWAILWSVDSLSAQMRRGDWPRAYQTAADLGHYVGDGHQPLHCTRNYDGALTGNNGIHSRYESGMIGLESANIRIVRDSTRYVADLQTYVLALVLRSNAAVDSILHGDTAAKAASGWNGSGTPPAAYYTALWERTGALTQALFQEATVSLASLWYTAWVNAGLSVTLAVKPEREVPAQVTLAQNYPNPFNPATVLSGTLGRGTPVRLAVYDLLGREVAVLMDGARPAGSFSFRFDAAGLPSGTYFYRLTTPAGTLTRTMAVVR